jgi:hypothetical protein
MAPEPNHPESTFLQAVPQPLPDPTSAGKHGPDLSPIDAVSLSVVRLNESSSGRWVRVSAGAKIEITLSLPKNGTWVMLPGQDGSGIAMLEEAKESESTETTHDVTLTFTASRVGAAWIRVMQRVNREGPRRHIPPPRFIEVGVQVLGAGTSASDEVTTGPS